MTPEEVAKEFILEMLDIDVFDYGDLVEWVDVNEVKIDSEDPYEKIWNVIAGDLDTMVQRYADSEN